MLEGSLIADSLRPGTTLDLSMTVRKMARFLPAGRGPRQSYYAAEMAVTHRYELTVQWTGNAGTGTSDYCAYRRDHEISGHGKPTLLGSSDPAFRGDAAGWNPEELLVAALSQCHMLWYLHLCANGGVVVTDYTDTPVGTMTMDATGGGGQFTGVTLRPAVTVADPSMADKAMVLHDQINAVCFIARSVNFPVRHEPTVRVATDA